MSKNTNEKAIRIRRAPHNTENPYYMASRATAQNKAISYDALGLLNYILSKPDDWRVLPVDLERKDCGRNKVYKVLNELILSGYIERIYHRDDRQRVVLVEYIAHEVSGLLPEKQEVEKQEVEKRYITEDRMDLVQSVDKKEKKARARTSSIATRQKLVSRVTPLNDLAHEILKAHEPGYRTGMYKTPAEYLSTNNSLEAWLKVFEGLSTRANPPAPAEIPIYYAELSAHYKRHDWTVGRDTILEQFDNWRGGKFSNGMSRQCEWQVYETPAVDAYPRTDDYLQVDGLGNWIGGSK